MVYLSQELFSAALKNKNGKTLTNVEMIAWNALNAIEKAAVGQLSNNQLDYLSRKTDYQLDQLLIEVLWKPESAEPFTNNARGFSQGNKVPVEEQGSAEPEPAVSTAAIKANGNKVTFLQIAAQEKFSRTPSGSHSGINGLLEFIDYIKISGAAL